MNYPPTAVGGILICVVDCDRWEVMIHPQQWVVFMQVGGLYALGWSSCKLVVFMHLGGLHASWWSLCTWVVFMQSWWSSARGWSSALGWSSCKWVVFCTWV